MKKKEDVELVNQTEFARRIGVTKGRITAMIKHGKIPAKCIKKEGRKTLIYFDKAKKALGENLAQPWDASGKVEKDETLTEYQRQKAMHQARLLEIEVEKAEGLLMERAVASRDHFAILRAVRDSFDESRDFIIQALEPFFVTGYDIRRVEEIFESEYRKILSGIHAKVEELDKAEETK